MSDLCISGLLLAPRILAELTGLLERLPELLSLSQLGFPGNCNAGSSQLKPPCRPKLKLPLLCFSLEKGHHHLLSSETISLLCWLTQRRPPIGQTPGEEGVSGRQRQLR